MIHISYNCDTNTFNEMLLDEKENNTRTKKVLYDELDFHSYHRKFADEVIYFSVFKERELLGECILGEKNGALNAPYSAPFSKIYLKDEIRFVQAVEVVDAIVKLSENRGIGEIKITLPPDIYSRENIKILESVLYSSNFKVTAINVNSHYELFNFGSIDQYLEKSSSKVRTKYRRTLRNGLKLKELNYKEIEVAYEVIKKNREQMGYSLNLSLEHIKDISKIYGERVRCFVVEKADSKVAAAIIFDVTEDISQIIYWGHDTDYNKDRPMDFLPIEIFSIYHNMGKKYLDIGPSSEDGVINAGLADFKKSLGCDTAVKLTFKYTVTE